MPQEQSAFSPHTDDKTVMILLRKPALSYMRDLRRSLETDPGYLEANSTNVQTKVTEFLFAGGVFWDQEIFEREWKNVVREAMVRLKSVER